MARGVLGSPSHHAVLAREAQRLWDFGRAARLAEGGFGWLNGNGRVTPGRARPLYVTCRMTHAYALGALQGIRGAAELADHGIASLRADFRDEREGGWFTSIGPDGPVEDRKWAYPHAFVVLAAASAVVAERPGASEVLTEALEVMSQRFWDEDAGMVVEEWDRGFTTLDSYRGANANMHAVEAFLAAGTVTGEEVWHERALRIVTRMVAVAERFDWRLPEHFGPGWAPEPDRYRDRPRDPFKPFGSTPGHGLEWARLLLQLDATMVGNGRERPDGLVPAAERLFSRAVGDGWAADGTGGFVYTVDWQGAPVIRNRLHWVVCEALAAATVLWQVTGSAAYAERYGQFWDFAERHLIDTEGGSWHHELDEHNVPSATIRDGKADLYHALGALLLPMVTPGPSIATGLAALNYSSGDAQLTP